MEGINVAEIARSLGMTLDKEEESACAAACAELDEHRRLVVEARTFASQGGLTRPHRRPSPDENPCNALLVRCSVKERDAGPLHGKTAALKDHIALAGVPMQLGSHALEHFIPEEDATVVTRLLAAGCEIVGKANMDPFSHGAYGFGSGYGDFGRVENPCAPDHISGGSSSGSAAAVAAGVVDLALGGDQGGSIRIPAAFCGVVGLKPSFGLVPHTGIVGIESRIDYVGPLARTVRDAALALDAMAGPDGLDHRECGLPQQRKAYASALSQGVRGLRVGLLREGFGDPEAEADVEEEVREAVRRLTDAGATVSEVSVPEHLSAPGLLSGFMYPGHYLFFRTMCGMGPFGSSTDSLALGLRRALSGRLGLLPPRSKVALIYGAAREEELVAWHRVASAEADRVTEAYDRALGEVDCLAMPTVPIRAPRYEPPKDRLDMLERTIVRGHTRVMRRNTAPFNVTGHPALTVPCGGASRLPAGVMLVGRRCDDDVLLRIGQALESLRA